MSFKNGLEMRCTKAQIVEQDNATQYCKIFSIQYVALVFEKSSRRFI